MTSRRHAPFDSGDAEDGLGALRPMKFETAGEVKRGGGCSAVPLWIQRLALLLGVPLAIVLTLTVLYQSETGFVYTLGQCLWRTYGSVDEYSKSGTVYDSVTAVFTAQDSGGAGFFSARLPTDKRTRHNYPEVYDRVMAPYQAQESVTLLEVGVKKGGSLKLWREYFTSPSARIIGSDIDPGVPTFPSDVGVKVLILDSTDLAAVRRSFGIGAQLDVIVDDGCHRLSCIKQTFMNLRGLLKPDGVYIVEDWPSYYADFVRKGNDWEPESVFAGEEGWTVCALQDRDPSAFLVVVYPPQSRAPTLEGCVGRVDRKQKK